MAFSEKKLQEILNNLNTAYPDAGCALDHENTFQLTIAVALSAQTTDKSVNKVTPGLFRKFPTPEALAKADEDDIIPLIKTIGMYRTKSRNIIALAKKLIEDYDGQIPGEYDKLVTLPGVGRKTANVVLAEGFGEQRIAVDTHVFRVTNRIGIVNENNVLKTELALMKVLPEDSWTRFHHLFIFHGRNCCSARNPACDRCPISYLCEKVGLTT
ncbi:MAG: endonuclease III [Bacillota bacterium]|nr:endonuclease III [Bacillota bacterium]